MKVIKKGVGKVPTPNINSDRPKYFLGAILGVAQLGMSIYGAIEQHNAQKKAVEEQNKITDANNLKQFDMQKEQDNIANNNYGSDSNMTSYYAKGGVKPVASDMSVAFGATHNQSNGNGTGVPYKGVEVEGGGKQGNKPGEVIKHGNEGDFVFSDRIPFDDKQTFAQVAQVLTTNKAGVEKSINTNLQSISELDNKITKAGGLIQASNNLRHVDVYKGKNSKLSSELDNINAQIEQLKQAQLQKGIQMGIYNPDGTPKDTQNVPDGTDNIPDSNQPQNSEQMAYGGRPKLAGGGFDKFMSSPEGGGLFGLANTAVNLISNISTADTLSKLKLPSYNPIKAQSTSKVNMSADRNAIKEGVQEIGTYAENNLANPQAVLAYKQNANAKGLQQESQVNQHEQETNTNIENTNIQRQLQVDEQNNQQYVQHTMQQYQKDSQDINNQHNITAGLTHDLQSTLSNYQQGKQEEKVLRLYGRLSPDGLADRTSLVSDYDVNLSQMNSITDPTELENYLQSKGVPADKISFYTSKLTPSNIGKLYAPDTNYKSTIDSKYLPKLPFSSNTQDTFDMLAKFRKPILFK